MVHFFKFRQELFALAPAKDVYIKHKGGRGWPEECPPLRAANAFGFDILANFNLTFLRRKNGWKVQKDIMIESDFDYASTEISPGAPLVQQYAWFWEKGQRIPHVISDDVYKQIQNQVKVSSFLFLYTDPDELLLMTDIPNYPRPFRAMSAVIETDWYPASYPWHVVLELSPHERKITIKKGDPICRLIPIKRDQYTAKSMSPRQFDDFFNRGQDWLAEHGKPHDAGTMDITRTYVRQQKRPKFIIRDQ